MLISQAGHGPFKALSAAECPLKRRLRWPDYCNRKTRLTRLGMTGQGKAWQGAWDPTASTATFAGGLSIISEVRGVMEQRGRKLMAAQQPRLTTLQNSWMWRGA